MSSLVSLKPDLQDRAGEPRELGQLVGEMKQPQVVNGKKHARGC